MSACPAGIATTLLRSPVESLRRAALHSLDRPLQVLTVRMKIGVSPVFGFSRRDGLAVTRHRLLELSETNVSVAQSVVRVRQVRIQIAIPLQHGESVVAAVVIQHPETSGIQLRRADYPAI